MGYLSARHDFWPRPLSVGTRRTVMTCKANTGKTPRFLRFTEPCDNCGVGQLAMTGRPAGRGKSRPALRLTPGRVGAQSDLIGMPTGRVKFFNTDRRFDFILPDDGGPDVFVHVHDVETAGITTLVKRPTAHVQHRPNTRRPLKGCQSSLALTLFSPP